jgi:signal transduction histidine kinase
MPGFAIDEQTRTRYLSIVSDETSRLERLIKDLLDLARLDEGGAAFTRGDVPVSQLFGRVAARHEREAAAAGVTFQSIVERGAEVVRGDAGRLEQAIQNLAANALRYAPSGSAIELRARPVNERVSIEVTDHGPGIPAEHLPRIFDRFYKAEESRTAHQNARGASGSGLGLSIVKAIAERHGARVTVRSEPGQTTFEIEGL